MPGPWALAPPWPPLSTTHFCKVHLSSSNTLSFSVLSFDAVPSGPRRKHRPLRDRLSRNSETSSSSRLTPCVWCTEIMGFYCPERGCPSWVGGLDPSLNQLCLKEALSFLCDHPSPPFPGVSAACPCSGIWLIQRGVCWWGQRGDRPGAVCLLDPSGCARSLF